MAVILLRVLVLGVIAAAADDASIKWVTSAPASLACEVPDAHRLQVRRPPPPLDSDRPRSKPYSWTRDGVEVSPKRIHNNGTLDVPKKRYGVYQCSVKHYYGRVLGNPVTVKSVFLDRHILVHPENMTARRGQPVALSCDVASAPDAVLSWTKDGSSLVQNNRYYELKKQLLILDVREENAGVYRCIAKNPKLNKQITSNEGQLLVAEDLEDQEPQFLSVSQDMTIYTSEGSRVVLACPVVGMPRPKLTWQRTPPQGLSEVLMDEDEVLVLNNLAWDMDGQYTCSVDGYSHLSKSFNVVLTKPVRITQPPVSKDAVLALTVRFTCTAEGTPEPAITWYKDGKLLNIEGRIKPRKSADGQRIELVIGGVTTTNDSGVYQCFASNGITTASAWAWLNVTGGNATAPENVRCQPTGGNSVMVTWTGPVGQPVIAYYVDVQPAETGTGMPHNSTEEIINVEKALSPYTFQVRAIIQKHPKNQASEMSEKVTCQGQGVPVKLSKISEDQVEVSWEKFAASNPEAVEWILQYKYMDSDQERNITLGAATLKYLLKASPSAPLQVRLLGTKSSTWMEQDLSRVPWTSTVNAGQDEGDTIPIPDQVTVTRGSGGDDTAEVRWRERCASCQYHVCSMSRYEQEFCQPSFKQPVILEELQPDTNYSIRVQAWKQDAALMVQSVYSDFYYYKTPPVASQRFKDLTSQYINSTTILVSWKASPGQYRAHYSRELKLPIEKWASVETNTSSVLINKDSASDTTYILVTGYNPKEYSTILTVSPQPKVEEVTEVQGLVYSYHSGGVTVSWSGAGPKLVRYSQNITSPLEQWRAVNVTDNYVELTNLSPSLQTYVMVSPPGALSERILTVPARPETDYTLHIGLGFLGVILLLAAVAAAVCMWRRRKNNRSPIRSRRAAAEAEHQGSDMTVIGGRLANGGTSKDAGEPLLNGHVHITENPTSKTPNGKLKKGSRRYEAAFDFSRHEDPDTTMETTLDESSTTCNLSTPLPPARLLDTSRHALDLSRSSHSFNKLPDDNMNSEFTRSTEFELDNSKIPPTLQPNG